MSRDTRSVKQRRAPAAFSLIAMAWLASLGCEPPAQPPASVLEVPAPRPFEISGVAAVADGYAVVGDSSPDHGIVWPGGRRFDIDPPVYDIEALDVALVVGKEESELWLLAGEDDAVIVDLDGGRASLPEPFREQCNRGLEGLAIREHPEALKPAQRWQVAALWEGGFFSPPCRAETLWRAPRVLLFEWTRGRTELGPHRSFELSVTVPGPAHRFRAPDLVWIDDELLVLLSSQDTTDGTFPHTWLQRFDLDGRRVGEPYKLEEAWGAYREGRNWEGLDWTLDGERLVLGWDALSGHRALAIFALPAELARP